MSAIEIIYLTASILTLGSGAVIVLINPSRMINRGCLLAATLTAAWLFCIFTTIRIGQTEHSEIRDREVLFWLRMTNAVAAFLPWSYFLVKETILRTEPMMRTLLRSWVCFVASCALAALTFSGFFIPGDSTSEAPKRGFVYPIYIFYQTTICLWTVYDAYRSIGKCSGMPRIEIKFFVINFCLTTFAILVLSILGMAFNLALLKPIAPFIVLASLGLTLWALCYHRVFEARQLFATLAQRISTLAVLSGAVVVIYFYLASLISVPASLLVGAACGGLLATWWDHKAGLWLGLDAQQARSVPRAKIIEWARQVPDEIRLKHQFEDFLKDWCQTDRAALLSIENGIRSDQSLALPNDWPGMVAVVKNGWVTPESLQRRKRGVGTQECMDHLAKHRLGALLTIPKGSPTPSLMIALGQKESLRPYTYPHIQILLDIGELMDNILTHCRVATHSARIEKMETAAMISRGLAHDLNNLATPVSTFLLHMEGSVAAGSAESVVLADAKHSVKVMQDYIRESLFFARRLVPQFEPLLSTETLTSVRKLTYDRAKRHGVEVLVQTDGQYTFMADRSLIQRLVQNLVFNGIDASRPGSTVELALVATGPEFHRIAVVDHGTGIPVEVQARIFEPYFTTKDTGNEVRGMGLGLAICRKIVDLHHGKIEVTTLAGHGTTIAVTLPLTHAVGPVTASVPQPREVFAATCLP